MTNTVLYCIPLKEKVLAQYELFAQETIKRAREYRDMLKRYDIYCAKTWHKQFNGQDYVFVYHEVGPDFQNRMKHWDDSAHEFDRWFRENIMAVYDVNKSAEMETMRSIIDFN